jgi:hypothetical protein
MISSGSAGNTFNDVVVNAVLDQDAGEQTALSRCRSPLHPAILAAGVSQ